MRNYVIVIFLEQGLEQHIVSGRRAILLIRIDRADPLPVVTRLFCVRRRIQFLPTIRNFRTPIRLLEELSQGHRQQAKCQFGFLLFCQQPEALLPDIQSLI